MKWIASSCMTIPIYYDAILPYMVYGKNIFLKLLLAIYRLPFRLDFRSTGYVREYVSKTIFHLNWSK